ncbi:MAG TPA: ATP-dependent zinc metalloprotease FtsH [Candidatus Dormibacteraeota bacterium]|nr:ATP-dependent zinc metalloprotease FtsH [Candidatus Dormibacteraeota bacterium]
MATSPTRRPQLPTARTPGTPGTPGAPAPFWRSRGFWIYLVVLLLLNYLISALFFSGPARVTVPYTTFIQQVNGDNVTDITAQGNSIQGDFKRSVSYNGASGTAFQTQRPDFAQDNLWTLLTQHNVPVTAQPPGTQSLLVTLLVSFGPAVLLIAGFLYLSRRAAGTGAGGILGAFGRSQAKLYNPEDVGRVTFNDVAGIDDAKQDLAEVVDFLKSPEKYQKLGAQIPHGVLLVGPPGTGKTLLARAVAGESNRPFFSLSASEFVEAIVGVGAARVRDLFAKAKAAAPSIIFIDELDAIGRSRASSATFGANDEREQTLNQILTEMDGFTPNQNVVVLAATNRPEVLDPALLRPGRFDRRVTVSPPDRRGREAILRIHTRNVKLAPDVNLDDIAGATAGFVGADLRNVVNEAALVAARKGHESVTSDDFDEAIERSVLGLRRPISLGSDEKRLIAYHESGHALLGLLIPEADPVKKVTIVPRGLSLGVTYSQPIDDRYNYPEGYLRGRITAALGGRAAEEIAYGTVTTGAENDLQQVNQIARSMVLRWGMSPKLGPLNLVQPGDGAFPGQQFSPETANLLDEEVRRIVDECHREGIRMLTENRERLDHLAEAVLKKETLDEDEIYAATGLPRRPDQPRRAPPMPPDGSTRDHDLAKDEVGAGEIRR